MDDLERLGDIIGKIKTNAPEGFSERVLFAIESKERREDFRRAALYSGFAAVSALLFYLSASFAVSEFYRSGAVQLLSLLFSDFQSMLADWKDFAFSLAESLPIFPVIYVVASVSALMIFLASAISNIKKVEQIKRHYLKHA